MHTSDNDAALLFSHLGNARLEEAQALAETCLSENRNLDTAHFALGIIRYQRQDYDAAVAALRDSIAIKPSAAAWNNLGAAYRATGKLLEASASYKSALAINPAFADAAANHANVLMDLGNYASAETMARRAISVGARSHQVYVTLGNAQFRQGDLLEAALSYRKALEFGFNIGAARNLASTLANLGRLREAKQVYNAALSANPDPELHSSSLICLNYDPDTSAEDLRAAYARYETAYCKPLEGLRKPHTNTPAPDRRLRIGYVSPDLCNHVVAVFMLPVIARHDRSAFDIYCYADVRHVDETSRKFQEVAHWLQTTGMSDELLARRIADDEIDILIDLAGHSPENRQLLFARKPAPVQLSYVIGTGNTTGQTAIDGLIADAELLPADAERYISESPMRLARPFIAYAPPPTLPEVGPQPALKNGYMTFGYFGRPIRLNDRVVKVWSDILLACPRSHLRLDNKPFGVPKTQDEVRRRFQAHGITPDRLDLRDTPAHASVLAAYNEIDIALDPFPHNAGTTTLEALWMGVPVLTLTDRPPVGRIGASLLGALNLRGWIAEDEQSYIAKAESAASDLEGLSALRAGLRTRCETSPLGDMEDLTRSLEQLYRWSWQTWCARQVALTTA